MAESTDRYNHMMQEFDKLGITNQMNIWWTCKRKISTTIGNQLPSLWSPTYDTIKLENPNVYAGVFNCAMEHYTIVKQAYLRGFESILIMEDDFTFKKDVNFKDLFNNLPQDWDAIQYYMHPLYYDGNASKVFRMAEKYSYVKSKVGITGTNMYALNRKGMEYYINFMDNDFGYADKPFREGKFLDLNFYIVKSGVLISNTMEFPSTINNN
jgi:GR25 family glycosyltransferase involved in LPS biosynthesis